jgi:hypothetical protein
MAHVPLPLSQAKAREIQFRFWRKVKMGADDECWLWQAKARLREYGQFRAWGRPQYAHRVAYALGNGDIPEGAYVLHKCDTPLCCNPAHLFLGDQAANMKDRFAKGRIRTRMAA